MEEDRAGQVHLDKKFFFVGGFLVFSFFLKGAMGRRSPGDRRGGV